MSKPTYEANLVAQKGQFYSLLILQNQQPERRYRQNYKPSDL